MQSKFYLNSNLKKAIKSNLLKNGFQISYMDSIHAPMLLEIGIINNNQNINLIINSHTLEYSFNYSSNSNYINWQPNLRKHLPNIISQLFNNYINQAA